MLPMSQTLLSTWSANSPGVLKGTYCTGTPSLSAMACAMSGDTPSGSPLAARPVTSRKLERLIPARRTPVGASSAFALSFMVAVYTSGRQEKTRMMDGIVVETASGRVRGTTERGVNVFKGIPYAAPPLGPLRWQAPQEVTPWSGVRDAASYGNMAIQAENVFGLPPDLLRLFTLG